MIALTRRKGIGQHGRRFLITGTPGSGKRAIGSHLVAEHSYVHRSLDSPDAGMFLAADRRGMRAELQAMLDEGRDVVFTWSARSDAALPLVRVLESLGFEWIWCDGDRGASFDVSLARSRRMRRARFVDTFAADGSFRPLNAVVAELLDGGRVLEPSLVDRLAAARGSLARLPVRMPRWRVAPLRWALTAAVGVAAAAATAVGGLILLGGGGVREPAASAVADRSALARPAVLPRRGVLVSGRSLAGVRLGDKPAAVRKRWGHDFTVCRTCRTKTWLYLYRTGDPVGAGVKFRGGRVTAVFTLGMTIGWRSKDGLRVGQLVSNDHAGKEGESRMCAGYSATSKPSRNAVTSVLTVGAAVYGFSLSRPTESVCP